MLTLDTDDVGHILQTKATYVVSTLPIRSALSAKLSKTLDACLTTKRLNKCAAEVDTFLATMKDVNCHSPLFHVCKTRVQKYNQAPDSDDSVDAGGDKELYTVIQEESFSDIGVITEMKPMIQHKVTIEFLKSRSP